MMRTKNFNELLLGLYACPDAPSRWPSVLDRICKATDARSAVIQRLVTGHDHARARWMARDSLSEQDAAVHERYMGDDVNPRMRIANRPPLAASKGIIRDTALFAPGDPALAELRERLAALRLGSFLGVTMALPDGTVLVLALHRDLRNHREFSRAEESFARQLLPHLDRAVTLSEQHIAFQTRNDDFVQMLDAVGVGCVVCGPEGRVHWANHAAQRTFSQRDRLWVRQERLTCANVQETGKLHELINKAVANEQSHGGADCVALGHNGAGDALHLLSLPVRTHAVADCTHHQDERRALLLFTDSGSTAPLSAERIGRLFGLSPAEARVAAALCEGISISGYAAAHGITNGTARFQLKQVLAKTGAERQSDLIRKLLSSVIAQVER